MPLYVIRHGETEYTARRLYNGTFDEPLSAVGEAQARGAADAVAAIPFERIFCSPLSRTRRTCELVNVRRVPVTYDARLLERDMGVLTSQPYTAADGRRLWAFDPDYDALFPGLERSDAIVARARGVVNALRESCAGQTVLLVTHGGFIRALRAAVGGVPEGRELADVAIPKNCELSLLCEL